MVLPSPRPSHRRHPRALFGAAFAAVLAAAVMDLMDTTITQVAGPAIRGDLHGSDALLEWVTAAYTLASTDVAVKPSRQHPQE